MEHPSDCHKDRPNQHKNSHNLRNEKGHPLLILKKTQWELRQQNDQIYPMQGKPV